MNSFNRDDLIPIERLQFMEPNLNESLNLVGLWRQTQYRCHKCHEMWQVSSRPEGPFKVGQGLMGDAAKAISALENLRPLRGRIWPVLLLELGLVKDPNDYYDDDEQYHKLWIEQAELSSKAHELFIQVLNETFDTFDGGRGWPARRVELIDKAVMAALGLAKHFTPSLYNPERVPPELNRYCRLFVHASMPADDISDETVRKTVKRIIQEL